MTKWKPRSEQIRMIYTDGPGNNDVVNENRGKVFAVIGPFESFSDKEELQDALRDLLRKYNRAT